MQPKLKTEVLKKYTNIHALQHSCAENHLRTNLDGNSAPHWEKATQSATALSSDAWR